MTYPSRPWLNGVRAVLVVTAVAAALVLSTPGVSARQAPAPQAPAPAAAPALTDEQIEQFLLKAKVIRTRGASKGITASVRATLSDGTLTHDAHIQSVDIEKARFDGTDGVEFNFRDSWQLNVAAYKLDRMIGLNMVPVSVTRLSGSKPAAYTWWIDNVLMEEGDRLKQNVEVPDPDRWNEQMRLVRVFDQLIYNVDRNGGNLIITKDWRIWAIDHTRAFRRIGDLRKPADLTHCDRQLLAKMEALDASTLKSSMHGLLSEFEIKALLSRRDKIVARLHTLGPSAMFDRRPLQAQGSQ